jgi:hypothetical protein
MVGIDNDNTRACVAKVRSDKDVARGRAKEDRRGGWR